MADEFEEEIKRIAAAGARRQQEKREAKLQADAEKASREQQVKDAATNAINLIRTLVSDHVSRQMEKVAKAYGQICSTDNRGTAYFAWCEIGAGRAIRAGGEVRQMPNKTSDEMDPTISLFVEVVLLANRNEPLLREMQNTSVSDFKPEDAQAWVDTAIKQLLTKSSVQ